MVSPRLAGSSTSVAGKGVLWNVRVPPFGATVKAPPPAPKLKAPTVMFWFKLMVWLAAITSLKSLNGVDGLGGLFQGGKAWINLFDKGLRKKEAAVVMGRLLLRSESKLTSLDLRCDTEAR